MAPASVTNNARRPGSHGVALEAGGSVTNNASASIAGQVAGVLVQGGAGTVTNAGSITATASGGAGADLEGGGTIANQAGGTLSGSAYGVFLDSSGTVANNGTISGASYAVRFAPGGTNRLVVNPQAVFNGAVGGGSGANSTLELGSGGTGTISGLWDGTGTAAENGSSWFFLSFNALAADSGASWTLTGTDREATVTDNGTLAVSGSLDVNGAIDPASTGVFQLDSGASLEVASALGGNSQMQFLGSSELKIDNAGQFGTNVGQASYAGPQLQGFAAGDTIDFLNFGSAGATFTYNASNGVLQLTNGAAQAASLHFQASSLGGSVFQVAGDGGSGTVLTRA